MKKLLTLLALLSCTISAKATHLMGGEMTVEHTTGNQFIIHLTAYRDTIGVPFLLTANFKVYNSSNTVVVNSTVPQDNNSGNLIPGAPYGVEIYFFTDTITIPGPGQYRVEWLNCCRNGAISNLTAPLNENMFLYTTFTHYGSSPFNSTPEFLAPPVTFVPINLAWQYNSLPLDPDGDSLSWTLDTPYTSSGVYAGGWITPSAAANGAFTLDPVTGQIDWTPNMYGNFVASIKVEEFRAGTKIGEIRRDYQMIIIDDTTKKTSPRITNMGTVFPVNGNGHYYKTLPVNTPVNISLLAEDLEGNQVEFLTYGEPYLLTQNPATFNTFTITPSKVMGIFQWTPDMSQARTNPYIVVFRTRDEVFSFDETVLFFVGSATGISQQDNEVTGPLYPNPAINMVWVPVSLEAASEVSVVLFNSAGMKAATYDFGTLPAGNHMQQLELDLAAGLYTITLLKDGHSQTTQKLLVQ